MSWRRMFRNLKILNMSIKQYLWFRNISRLLCAEQKGRIQECHKRCWSAVCDNTLTGCRSSLALAHILGRPVLEQSKVNFRFFVPPMRKDDDDRYAQFKTAQKVLNKQVMTKEAQLSSSKSTQTVLDSTSRGKSTVTEEMNTVESKTLDSAIANVF